MILKTVGIVRFQVVRQTDDFAISVRCYGGGRAERFRQVHVAEALRWVLGEQSM